MNVTWEMPSIPNGIIRSYTITILTVLNDPVVTVTHTGISVLHTTIYGLTPNTNYTVDISAVTVEPGDVASLSFTTPSCKQCWE